MRASRPDAFVVPIDEPGVAVLLAEFGLEHLDVELREHQRFPCLFVVVLVHDGVGASCSGQTGSGSRPRK